MKADTFNFLKILFCLTYIIVTSISIYDLVKYINTISTLMFLNITPETGNNHPF